MNKMLGALALFVIIGFMLTAVNDLRDFGTPVNTDMDDHFINNGQDETGANNIVTSVVFDYRAFDTIGEAVVLFTAVTGVALVFKRWKE